MKNIKNLIQSMVDNAGVTCSVCTVTAVDKAARTIDCEPLNEDAPLLSVNLQANQDSKVGLVQFPRIGSFVVVAFVSDDVAAVVLLCEDIESMEVVVGTSSMVVNDNGVVFNSGNLGGIVKVEGLTGRLNTIERDINNLKSVFKGWTPVPQDGGSSLKAAVTTWSGSNLVESKRSDYENEKVKQ